MSDSLKNLDHAAREAVDRARRKAEERNRPDPERFKSIAAQIGELLCLKNEAYGDSFNQMGTILETLYPGGIPVSQLNEAAVVVRILDKLKRIATARDAFGESPWQDIAGYAILALERQERQNT